MTLNQIENLRKAIITTLPIHDRGKIEVIETALGLMTPDQLEQLSFLLVSKGIVPAL